MDTPNNLKSLIETQVANEKRLAKLNEQLQKLQMESKTTIDALEPLLSDQPIAVKVAGKVWEAFRPAHPTQRASDGRIVVRVVKFL